MAIYQSASGFGVDYRDEFGRRHRQHVGTRTQAEHISAILSLQVKQTKAKLSEIRAETGGLKVSEGIELYLQASPTTGASKAKIRRILTRFQELVGDIPASHVTPQLMQRYHAARSIEASPTTLTKECIYVRAFYRYLSKWWGVPEGAASMLPCKWTHSSAGLAISFQQEAEALQNCTRPGTRLKLLLGIDAGLRSGELKLLRWNAINSPLQEIIVWPSKPGRPRAIPMTPRLAQALQMYTPRQVPNPEALLFPFQQEKQTHPVAFLEKHRLKGTAPFRFHDLRHTFASRLADLGTPQHVISALLGHSPVTTTQIYLHASPEAKRAAIKALAEHVQANLLTKELT